MHGAKDRTGVALQEDWRCFAEDWWCTREDWWCTRQDWRRISEDWWCTRQDLRCFAEGWWCTRQDWRAIDRTGVALQKAGGALERTGGAKTGLAVQKTGPRSKKRKMRHKCDKNYGNCGRKNCGFPIEFPFKTSKLFPSGALPPVTLILSPGFCLRETHPLPVDPPTHPLFKGLRNVIFLLRRLRRRCIFAYKTQNFSCRRLGAGYTDTVTRLLLEGDLPTSRGPTQPTPLFKVLRNVIFLFTCLPSSTPGPKKPITHPPPRPPPPPQWGVDGALSRSLTVTVVVGVQKI